MDFFTWLFDTRAGVFTLIGAGLVICLIVAFVLERKTRKLYFNHEKQEGESDSLFEGLFDNSNDDEK